MSGSITNIARGIEEQATLIVAMKERGIGSRLLAANLDEEELERCYRRISSLFLKLQVDANLSIWDIVNDQMAEKRLEKLSSVNLASYDSRLSTTISRRTCTEGTRTAILAGLDEWSHNVASADLY